MKLASLFSDHAILQREISVPVWGWMKPKSRVQVKLGDYVAQSLSGADGKFLVRLPPMPAGGPFKLEVSSSDSRERATASDVWVGEVWLASGQSNMQFTVSNTGKDDEFDELAADDNLRMITVPNRTYAGRQSEFEGEWQAASKRTVGTFTAVGAHFAHVLSKKLGVKIGVIHSSWGGTIAEAWTSRETISRNPEQAARLASYESQAFAKEFWSSLKGVDLSEPSNRGNYDKKSPYPVDKSNEGVKKGWAKAEFDDSSWKTMKIPGPWTSYGNRFSGVFWFRLAVDIPAKWAGKSLVLGLGAIDKTDISYFNGVEVGSSGKGFDQSVWNVPRFYTIPGKLVKAGRNVIAVRAYSFVFDGGLIGPASRMALALEKGDDAEIKLAGEWKYAIEKNFGLVTAPGGMSPGPGCQNSFGILFDNMIAPLLPYAIRGALWYQGESNASNSAEYARLFRDMIRDWRFAWGQGDFPFYFVQLANFAAGANFPQIREAQLETLAEPNTGMALAIDIGDSLDIHPKDKKTVGERLARWALNDVYGRPCEVSGPLFSSLSIEGSKLRLRFSHVGGGLVSKGSKTLKGFELTDGKQVFYPAEAKIEGDSVVLSHPKVDEPLVARYAWDPDPQGANLYNKAGLPASPFRTMKSIV